MSAIKPDQIVAVGVDPTPEAPSTQETPETAPSDAQQAAPQKKRKQLVDMQSHHGLRGWAALWIVLFHACRLTAYGRRINLNGSAAMSLFFILSGFPQAVIYGAKAVRAPKLWPFGCKGSSAIDEGDAEAALPPRFKAKRYWQNRFARLYPVYFLTSAIAFPLAWLVGSPTKADIYTPGEMAWYILSNVFLIQNWGMLPPNDYFGHSINGAAWFVSVVWFQYLIFPFTLPLLLNRENKVAWSIGLYFAQCAGATGVFFGISPIGTGMSAATMNLFFPGMCMFLAGGLLGLWAQSIKDRKVANETEKTTDEEHDCGSSIGSLVDENLCASVADATSIGIVLWLLVFTILSANGNNWGGFGAFFVQIYGSIGYMILAVALCFDNGKSTTAKSCRNKVATWLGENSMSVYLFHLPFMEYFGVFLEAVSPEMITAEDKANGIGIGLPVWTIPITVVLSYLFGFALERLVAVPTRKCLRAK